MHQHIAITFAIICAFAFAMDDPLLFAFGSVGVYLNLFGLTFFGHMFDKRSADENKEFTDKVKELISWKPKLHEYPGTQGFTASGKHKGRMLSLSLGRAAIKKPSKKDKTSSKCHFNLLMVQVKMKKDFPGTMYIYPRVPFTHLAAFLDTLSSKLKKIETEDPKFTKRFYAISTDPLAAKNALTEDLMQRLLENPIYLCIHKNEAMHRRCGIPKAEEVQEIVTTLDIFAKTIEDTIEDK